MDRAGERAATFTASLAAADEPSPACGTKILVLCLGNDILTDDGVGLQVASLLEADPPPGAVICRSALSGFYLLDQLLGFEKAVVVDAIKTGEMPAGHIWVFSPEDLQAGMGPSPHSVGLPGILALGRASGLALPSAMRVVAIEVQDMETIGEGLTPAVGGAVCEAAKAVRAAVAQMAGGGGA